MKSNFKIGKDIGFLLNSLNSVTKIFVMTVKGFEPAASCVRDQDAYHSTSKTHLRDKIVKLTLIHVSVTYPIHWIHQISILFGENSSIPLILQVKCYIFFYCLITSDLLITVVSIFQKWVFPEPLKNYSNLNFWIRKNSVVTTECCWNKCLPTSIVVV